MFSDLKEIALFLIIYISITVIELMICYAVEFDPNIFLTCLVIIGNMLPSLFLASYIIDKNKKMKIFDLEEGDYFETHSGELFKVIPWSNSEIRNGTPEDRRKCLQIDTNETFQMTNLIVTKIDKNELSKN
jgi:hypothetical protein